MEPDDGNKMDEDHDEQDEGEAEDEEEEPKDDDAEVEDGDDGAEDHNADEEDDEAEEAPPAVEVKSSSQQEGGGIHYVTAASSGKPCSLLRQAQAGYLPRGELRDFERLKQLHQHDSISRGVAFRCKFFEKFIRRRREATVTFLPK